MGDDSNPPQLDQPPKALRDDARLDPYEWYQEMRDENPVRYDEERGVWDVFRYDDAKRVLRDHDTFSSSMDPEPNGVANGQPDGQRTETDESKSTPFGDMLIATDPPKHDRIRSVVAEHFQADAIRSYRPRVEAIATDLVDNLEPGEVDLVESFSDPLPVDVIAGVLGVPREERATFKRWSDAVTGVATAANTGITREEAFRRMSEYFGRLLTDRRQNPCDDLLTAIATAGDESELSDREMVSLCIFLLIAGNVTTTNLLTNAVWSFHEHGVLDDVQTGAVPLQPSVEEALRYRSPVQKVERVAHRDSELGGETIEAGEFVVVWLGAANRDDRHFDDPEKFDPTRRPNDHLAFGQGIHFCLGAPLARLEVQVGLTALFETFDVTASDTTDLSRSSGEIYGLEEFVVTLS